MIRDPHLPFNSQTLAETVLAEDGYRAGKIPMQGYGPARRALAGIMAVALVIGAGLPVGAAGEGATAAQVCRIEIGTGGEPVAPVALARPGGNCPAVVTGR